VEDPAFHPTTGHLYVLEGSGVVTDVDPFDGVFGNGNDLLSAFAIPNNGDGQELQDVEALAYDPVSGNLVAGARFGDIYEFTTGGIFVQQHEIPDTVPINSLSGLTAQPPDSLVPVTTYWMAERGENGSPPAIDGGLVRVTFGPAPDLPPAAPVLAPLTTPMAVNEGTATGFDANATDANFGDTLTYSLTGQPVGSTFDAASGVFSWTPSEGQGAGVFNLTVTVTDSTMLVDSQVVQINVAEVNRAPMILGGPFAPIHSPGEAVNFPMARLDPDLPAQTLTWSATGLPPNLSIHPTTGTISGTVAAGALSGSPYDVTVTVTDNGLPAMFDQEMFQWVIQNTNPHEPVLGNITNKAVARNSLLQFNAAATDADGDGLNFSLVNPPAGASITAGGQFTWTPSQAPGNYQVTVKVSDTGTPVRSDQQTFTVTVSTPDPSPDDGNPFTDDDGHIFENAIEWLDAQGITTGCNPPFNDRFCPDDRVSRGQMAAFLVRALHYPNTPNDYFTDDSGSVFQGAINRLRAVGVTQGCNPPNNSRYCPDGFVTRGQMAAFLVRALDLPDYNGPDRFIDDDGHLFEGAIERLAQAGITVGCNPPANERFCPNEFVTRGQMAAFLKRALGG
jgi:hypothetical protein